MIEDIANKLQHITELDANLHACSQVKLKKEHQYIFIGILATLNACFWAFVTSFKQPSSLNPQISWL